jgi:hypothetical protein
MLLHAVHVAEHVAAETSKKKNRVLKAVRVALPQPTRAAASSNALK